jgi:hypothetical protein
MKDEYVTRDWVIRFTLWVIGILGVLSMSLFAANLVSNVRLQHDVEVLQEILLNTEVIVIDEH